MLSRSKDLNDTIYAAGSIRYTSELHDILALPT